MGEGERGGGVVDHLVLSFYQQLLYNGLLLFRNTVEKIFEFYELYFLSDYYYWKLCFKF